MVVSSWQKGTALGILFPGAVRSLHGYITTGGGDTSYSHAGALCRGKIHNCHRDQIEILWPSGEIQEHDLVETGVVLSWNYPVIMASNSR